jgi:hypothetical protein
VTDSRNPALDRYVAEQPPSMFEQSSPGLFPELDAVMERDRAWLEAHPSADGYWRPLTEAELTQYRRSANTLGCEIRKHFRVNVVVLPDDAFRTRYLVHKARLACAHGTPVAMVYGIVQDTLAADLS